MRTAAPALLPLFRSETQLHILAELFAGADVELQVADLAERASVPAPTASRELSRLQRHGLVTSRVFGRSRLYRADWSLPWAKELSSILVQTVGVLPALAGVLRALSGIHSAYVFGSWAARHAGAAGPWPRDVDVVVVGDPDQFELMRAARQVEDELRVDVNTVVVDPSSWENPEPDSFVAQIQQQPLTPIAIGVE